MQFHFHVNQIHFHKNGFAFRLALKQRHKRTRKWPITQSIDWLINAISEWTKLPTVRGVVWSSPRFRAPRWSRWRWKVMKNSQFQKAVFYWAYIILSQSVVLLPPIDSLDVRRFINFILIVSSKCHKGLIIQKKIAPYMNLSTHWKEHMLKNCNN